MAYLAHWWHDGPDARKSLGRRLIRRKRNYWNSRKCFRQCLSHALEDRFPIAKPWLAKEAQGRIPGAVLTVEQPAPVGRKRQGRPGGDAESAGQMSEDRVTGDHEVDGRHEGGGVHERAGVLIELIREVGNGKTDLTQLLTARTFLQTDKPHARHAGQRREAGQRDRAPVILAIQAAPLPGDADLEAVEWGELAL